MENGEVKATRKEETESYFFKLHLFLKIPT